MSSHTELIEAEHRKIQQAFAKARERVYKIHQALGVPVVVMRNGKITEMLPDELKKAKYAEFRSGSTQPTS